MRSIIAVFNDPGTRDRVKKDRLVSDLAIYNWKELNEKYGLEAGEIMAIITDWNEWVRENVTELIVVNWN